MNIHDYITGEQFIALADGVKTFYCHTHDVNAFFKALPTDNPFVLISHNSDGCITSHLDRWDCADIDLAPYNLIHWFGQNVNVIDYRVTSIPIGLENSKWTQVIHKPELMAAKLRMKRINKNLVYMNHNINTNPAEREKPYKLLEKMSWVTAEHGVNFKGFDNYLENIYSHPFVICPAGNGLDTHRTWEALYMGSIPIEKRNLNNRFYEDLPICFVNDWEEITYDFLILEMERINSISWNMQKLTFSYWKGVIQEAKKKCM